MDKMRNRIITIEAKNKGIEDIMFGIIENANNSEVNTISKCDEIPFTELTDNQDDLENALTSLQSDVIRVDHFIHLNEDKICKLNHQLHVLSAMFVDFNEKINEHFLDYNRRNIAKIEASLPKSKQLIQTRYHSKNRSHQSLLK